MDLRQWPQWGNYLSKINWQIERVANVQIFIRKIPLLNYSLIKIQHPDNPLPFFDIDKIAKKHQALFVQIEPVNQNYKPDDFLKNGYCPSKMFLSHSSTILIDLRKSSEELWSSFSENARRNIKKAQQNDLLVKEVFLRQVQDDKDFEDFFQLLMSLTKLKNFYIPPYKEFYKRMQALKKNTVLLFAYTKEDPKPIAGVWLAYWQKSIVYLQTGITQAGYQKMANYLLVWQALQLGQRLHLATFDFEGIYDTRFPNERKRWKSFTEFKKRFHGEIIEYPRPWIKYYSLIFKLFYLCMTHLPQ